MPVGALVFGRGLGISPDGGSCPMGWMVWKLGLLYELKCHRFNLTPYSRRSFATWRRISLRSGHKPLARGGSFLRHGHGKQTQREMPPTLTICKSSREEALASLFRRLGKGIAGERR